MHRDHIRIVDEAVAYISRLPYRAPGNPKSGRAWLADPNGVALMVKPIVETGNSSALDICDAIAKRMWTSPHVLRSFCRGLDASYKPWDDLRAAMKALGCTWLATARDGNGRTRTVRKHSTPTPPATSSADVAPQPIARPPAADTAPTPARTLVVTNGSVEVAAAPARIIAPSAMVAPSSPRASADAAGFARKTPPRDWRIEPGTNDIIVTTVRRLKAGTPEHAAKLLEVALSLGDGRA